MLPGSWQTSRQSAYSMATRCVEELHVFIDTQTPASGPYWNWHPIQALGDRWTADAKKIPASADECPRCDRPGSEIDSVVDPDVPAMPMSSTCEWTRTPRHPVREILPERPAADEPEIIFGG